MDGQPPKSSFQEVSIRYLAGTIESSEIMKFKRLVFRATRGKVLSYIETLDGLILTAKGD